jgi:hypothetical protein
MSKHVNRSIELHCNHFIHDFRAKMKYWCFLVEAKGPLIIRELFCLFPLGCLSPTTTLPALRNTLAKPCYVTHVLFEIKSSLRFR